MALVSYSDSEASDSEVECGSQSQNTNKIAPAPSDPQKPAPGAAGFQTIVDRSNPRKIRVALPQIKPDPSSEGAQEDEDGPSRKRPRIGGGLFSGFNSLLPAPKKANTTADKAKGAAGPTRKVFSLKTGATPGFDREADAEMRFSQTALDPTPDREEAAAASTSETAASAEPEAPKEEVKLKGNPMMFKPLSVARNSKKKKSTRVIPASAVTSETVVQNQISQPAKEGQTLQSQSQTLLAPSVTPKPKVSLFSLSTDEDRTGSNTNAAEKASAYEPMVYTSNREDPAAGPQPEVEASSVSSITAGSSNQAPTLDNIANDLNLSRSQRRQLFGRQAASASRILTFNTDAEYAANQAMAHETDLAAVQHNPVRAIAPGKHSLQQLVNAANSQRDALEESFATGRRNKKEAGSKYGW